MRRARSAASPSPRAQTVERRERRRVELFQRDRFGPGHQQRQCCGEFFCKPRFAAVDFDPLRPAPRKPAQGGPEKAVADPRARDPRVGKRLAMTLQIGASGETREHALGPGENARIVRVGAQEAQHFVQAKHRSRRAQFGALQRSEQCQLRIGAACAVMVPRALELGKNSRRHDFAPAVNAKIGDRMSGSRDFPIEKPASAL